MTKRPLPVLLLLALVLGACTASPSRAGSMAAASSSRDFGARANSLLKQAVLKQSFRGSVLISRGGRVLFQRSYGFADALRRVRNTSHTRFLILSLTKQFTAAAVLQLQERGRLRVTDPVCRYVPHCPPDWRDITLEALLMHTSGLPRLPAEGYPYLASTADHPSDTTVLRTFERSRIGFLPGTRFRYSNLGYFLLGYIIEKASGISYAQYLQRHIFAPLGMKQTGYWESGVPPRLATGYADWVSPVVMPHTPFSWDGAMGLYSTIHDLYLWDEALDSTKILSRSSWKRMFTPRVTIPEEEEVLYGVKHEHCGYGWFLSRQGTHELVFHTGQGMGFRSFNGRYRTDDVNIIVLANQEDASVEPIALHLGALLFPASQRP